MKKYIEAINELRHQMRIRDGLNRKIAWNVGNNVIISMINADGSLTPAEQVELYKLLREVGDMV